MDIVDIIATAVSLGAPAPKLEMKKRQKEKVPAGAYWFLGILILASFGGLALRLWLS